MANLIDTAVLRPFPDGRLNHPQRAAEVDPRAPAGALPDAGFVEQVTQQTELLQKNALRLTRHRADAADLVQDTVEKALRNWRRFTQGSRMRAWLLTIMTNLFVDRCRRRTREGELRAGQGGQGGQDGQAGIDPPAPEPEELPAWARLSDEQVRRALAALDPSMREVYQLRAVQQLSYRSMSARLGIPVATVGTRLNRARLKLRGLLEAEVGGPGAQPETEQP